MPADPRTCRCGHGADAHEHFRRGTECAVCGPAACARFTAVARPSLLARLVGRLRHAPSAPSVVTHPTARRPARPDEGDHAREA